MATGWGQAGELRDQVLGTYFYCGLKHKIIISFDDLSPFYNKEINKNNPLIHTDRWPAVADHMDILIFIISVSNFLYYCRQIEKSTANNSNLIWDIANKNCIILYHYKWSFLNTFIAGAKK